MIFLQFLVLGNIPGHEIIPPQGAGSSALRRAEPTFGGLRPPKVGVPLPTLHPTLAGKYVGPVATKISSHWCLLVPESNLIKLVIERLS